MRQRRTSLCSFGLILLFTPLAASAFSTGPPVRRTSQDIDGGVICTQCHGGTPVNGGPGRVLVRANAYTPGVKQQITVEITDPNALRWGFEITARLAGNTGRTAGAFVPNLDSQVRCDDGSLRGVEGLCNGRLEFAMHLQARTRAGSPGPAQTFVLDWIPPANDVGDVIFYAAGNAANNSNTNGGDRIYTTNTKIGVTACNLTNVPSIRPAGGIVNAASLAAPISSNALITIFGGGFALPGDSYRLAAVDLDNGKVPASAACIALDIGGKRAPVYYIQNDQINAQAPILEGSGPVQVRVIANPGTPNEKRSDPVNANQSTYSPAFFLFAPSKSIAALNASDGSKILADASLSIPGSVSAKPGDVVTLYGTGFGFSEPVFQPGEFPEGVARLKDAATVTIGGTTLAGADVLFAGLAPDFPGFYQFNVRVPASAPDGNVPVRISIGGAQTQADATIPVKR
ncbi:MAG: choice-of-anchor V domain-containing protein [Bryobacteraceae bacterium]